jgi:hypothetical protein
METVRVNPFGEEGKGMFPFFQYLEGFLIGLILFAAFAFIIRKSTRSL